MLSAKILFLLMASTSFLQYTSQEKQIRGLPEVDYPTYYVIPKTSFRCSDQLYNPGFYADTETRCQVFHYCYEHRQESFLCPMGTIFNQPILACDYWYSSNCSLAPSYYNVNAEKRNEDNFAVDDPLDSQSENLFDKMAHLYEMNNKAPEPSVLTNDSDIPEIELLGRLGVESIGEPLIEDTKTEDYNKYSYDNPFNMVDEVHPEIVKYEVRGMDNLNIHEDSEKEQQYETDDVKDFIFSEDGMLHPIQEDNYQYPTDRNFNEGFSGYAEIPSKQNFNYDLNNDFDSESSFQISDFVFEKRYADVNGGYVKRRPSSRKPVMVIPEVEPEIVQLPVVKHQRKPIGIISTVSMNANSESSYETNYDFNIYKEDTVSAANEVFERTTTGEFPLNEPNFDLNEHESKNSKLFYKIQQETDDETGSQLPQADRLSVIDDYSNKKKTRKTYVLSNIDENESSSVLGIGSNDVLSVSNVDHRNALVDSNHDESEIFIRKVEDSTILPGESPETTVQDERDFGDLFLGSGSEEINQSHSGDRSSFPEDYDVFSDSDDTEIDDTEASYALPINLLDAIEGSGISVQETADIPNFTEEVNDPVQLILKEHPEDNIKYGKTSFSSETFGIFPPLEDSEADDEAEFVTDGSGEANGFDYLPHEVQESFDNPEGASDKALPEIREIDGSFYVFSDSEYNFNHGYDDSNGFHPENVDYALTENFEDVSDKTTEEWVDNKRFRNVPTEPKLKIDNKGNVALHTLDYQDSRHLVNTYEKFLGEFGATSDIPEKYIVDESDGAKQLSTEDLKYLEIMSQNPSPMLKNLFEISHEKSNSDAIEDEMLRIEIVSTEQDINEQAATHEDSVGTEDVMESESLATDISYIGERSADIESFENNSEDLSTEHIAEEISNTEGSGQDGSEIFSPEQNFEAFLSGKEGDPFNPLFVESDKIVLNGPGSKQELSLKVSPDQPKNDVVIAAMGKDQKKIARGKRFNENLRTLDPPKKGNPLNFPQTETFRETMFTNIPSAFLKMKHSTLRPYFYNYGSENSGFIPRTGNLLQSSKLSKLTSLGKRLLEAKSAKFNRVKKFIDSYRN